MYYQPIIFSIKEHSKNVMIENSVKGIQLDILDLAQFNTLCYNLQDIRINTNICISKKNHLIIEKIEFDRI